jgi:hypothetical protein
MMPSSSVLFHGTKGGSFTKEVLTHLDVSTATYYLHRRGRFEVGGGRSGVMVGRFCVTGKEPLALVRRAESPQHGP